MSWATWNQTEQDRTDRRDRANDYRDNYYARQERFAEPSVIVGRTTYSRMLHLLDTLPMRLAFMYRGVRIVRLDAVEYLIDGVRCRKEGGAILLEKRQRELKQQCRLSAFYQAMASA